MFTGLFGSRKFLFLFSVFFLGLALNNSFYCQSDEEKKSEFIALYSDSEKFKNFSVTPPTKVSYNGSSGWEIEICFRSGAEGLKTFKIFDQNFEPVNNLYRKYSARLSVPVIQDSLFPRVQMCSVKATPSLEVYPPVPNIFVNKKQKDNSGVKLVVKIFAVLSTVLGIGSCCAFIYYLNRNTGDSSISSTNALGQREVGGRDCAICLSTITNARVCVPCTHIFCRDCIERVRPRVEDYDIGGGLFERRTVPPPCPLCRQPIERTIESLSS